MWLLVPFYSTSSAWRQTPPPVPRQKVSTMVDSTLVSAEPTGSHGVADPLTFGHTAHERLPRLGEPEAHP